MGLLDETLKDWKRNADRATQPIDNELFQEAQRRAGHVSLQAVQDEYDRLAYAQSQQPARKSFLEWSMKGSNFLALTIAVVALISFWMLRFETVGQYEHRNRFTGAVCQIETECWWPE